MTTSADKNPSLNFDNIKDNNETILWTGRPKFIPFVFSGLLLQLFVIAFGILFTTFMAIREDRPGNDSGIVFGVAFGILFIFSGLSTFLRHWLSYRNTLYGYSDKRIMIRTGIFAPNFKVIDYEKS